MHPLWRAAPRECWMLPALSCRVRRTQALDLVRSRIVVGSADADRGSRPKDARELAASAINLGLANYRILICATAVVLVPTFVVGGTALGYWREKSAASLNPTGARGPPS